MKPQRKNKGVLYIRALDDNVKCLFKAACTEVYKPMQFVFHELMKRYTHGKLVVNTQQVIRAHEKSAIKKTGFLFFRCIPESDRLEYYAKVHQQGDKLNVVSEALLRAFIANPQMLGEANRVLTTRRMEKAMNSYLLRVRKPKKSKKSVNS